MHFAEVFRWPLELLWEQFMNSVNIGRHEHGETQWLLYCRMVLRYSSLECRFPTKVYANLANDAGIQAVAEIFARRFFGLESVELIGYEWYVGEGFDLKRFGESNDSYGIDEGVNTDKGSSQLEEHLEEAFCGQMDSSHVKSKDHIGNLCFGILVRVILIPPDLFDSKVPFFALTT